MSPTTVHLLWIDVPIALIVFGPILFVAAMVGTHRYRVLIVPAVMLSIVGASSLFTFYFTTYTAADSAAPGNATRELLWHLDEFGHITARTFVAVGLLFAGALVLCRLAVRTLSKAELRIVSTAFTLGYALGCVWLMVVAHHGAQLAEHLASHGGP